MDSSGSVAGNGEDLPSWMPVVMLGLAGIGLAYVLMVWLNPHRKWPHKQLWHHGKKTDDAGLQGHDGAGVLCNEGNPHMYQQIPPHHHNVLQDHHQYSTTPKHAQGGYSLSPHLPLGESDSGVRRRGTAEPVDFTLPRPAGVWPGPGGGNGGGIGIAGSSLLAGGRGGGGAPGGGSGVVGGGGVGVGMGMGMGVGAGFGGAGGAGASGADGSPLGPPPPIPLRPPQHLPFQHSGAGRVHEYGGRRQPAGTPTSGTFGSSFPSPLETKLPADDPSSHHRQSTDGSAALDDDEGARAVSKLGFGRSQFVQVFHDSPLVPRRLPAPVPPVAAPSRPADGHSPPSPVVVAGVGPGADASPVGRNGQREQGFLPPAPRDTPVAVPVVESRVPRADFDIEFSALKLGPLIGEGAFGKVYKGRWRGTNVAIKMLVCQTMTEEVIEEFRAEIAVLSSLRHPNVVLFMGAVTASPHYSLVTELVSRGSLWAVLHGDYTLDWKTILKMAMDTARGMAFLHSASPPILHRDLKSGNLLVDDSFNTKLTDFGLARVKAYTQTMTGSRGTFQWMAPEVLGNQKYTEKADVFSFAVVCWELITRKCPFESMNQIQMAMGVLNHGMREKIPPGVHPAYASLIQRCWHRDPAVRPSFLEALEALEAIPT